MRTRGRRAGFTLVELSIAVTILALVAVNVVMVLRTGSGAVRQGAFRENLEDELNLTLDRIKLALLSASADSLYPDIPAPVGTAMLRYTTRLGVNEGGGAVESDPERIAWEERLDGGRVIWTQNPELESERKVVWSNHVPVLHEGEVDNGVDDNDNELDDEPGLVFAVPEQEQGHEREVFIHLTVERVDHLGKNQPLRREINITCRN